jgi:2-polyprenyl-6-methoxyphenol hydroxylase-like FAD-dependent oxidoreductase
MKSFRVSPYYNMEVWDSTVGGSIRFDNSEKAGDMSELGFIIENRVIQAVLQSKLQSCSTVKFYCPSAVDSIEIGKSQKKGWEDWVKVTTKDGKSIRARLVVS